MELGSADEGIPSPVYTLGYYLVAICLVLSVSSLLCSALIVRSEAMLLLDPYELEVEKMYAFI